MCVPQRGCHWYWQIPTECGMILNTQFYGPDLCRSPMRPGFLRFNKMEQKNKTVKTPTSDIQHHGTNEGKTMRNQSNWHDNCTKNSCLQEANFVFLSTRLLRILVSRPKSYESSTDNHQSQNQCQIWSQLVHRRHQWILFGDALVLSQAFGDQTHLCAHPGIRHLRLAKAWDDLGRAVEPWKVAVPKRMENHHVFYGKSPCFYGKSPFFNGKSPFLNGKSPFF